MLKLAHVILRAINKPSDHEPKGLQDSNMEEVVDEVLESEEKNPAKIILIDETNKESDNVERAGPKLGTQIEDNI